MTNTPRPQLRLRYGTRSYFNVHETKLKSGKEKKIKVNKNSDMLGSIGKQSGESVESVRRKKRKAIYGGMDLQKREVLSVE